MLRDDVDRALFSSGKIGECVLSIGKSSRETDSKQWRVVIDYLCIREWRKICGFA